MPVDKVGIINLKLPVRISREGTDILLLPKIDVFIDFKKKVKGIRMSRLQTSIIEAISTKPSSSFIEDIGKRVLQNIYEKIPFSKGEICFSFDYPLKKITPKSNYEIKEVYPVQVTVYKINNDFKKKITCSAVGSSVCYAKHQQRAYIKSSITTDFDNLILFGDIVDCEESSFSAQGYSIVRNEDEEYLVKTAYNNPKLVEELVRETAYKLVQFCKKKNIKGVVEVEAVSDDSIHFSHSVYAKIVREVK